MTTRPSISGMRNLLWRYRACALLERGCPQVGEAGRALKSLGIFIGVRSLFALPPLRAA